MTTQPVEQTIQRPLWRNRSFLLLLGGQAISRVGTQVSQFAYPLLVLFVTGSPGLAGVTAGLVMVPYVLLCLPAGALVDRWDRRRVMIVCDLGRALALGSIPVALLLGHLTLVQLLLCPLLEGTGYVFFDLAEAASLLVIVPADQLDQAGARNQVVSTIAYLLGGTVGSVLLALGRLFPFLVDALSYGVSVATLGLIRGAFQGQRETRETSLRQEITEGVQWLWRERLIRLLSVLAGAGNGFDNALLLLYLVVMAERHVPTILIGLGVSAMGVGSLLGAWTAEWVTARVRLRTVGLVAHVVTVLVFPVFLLAPAWAVVVPACTIYSFCSALFGVIQYVYRMRLIPEPLQGRVTSVFRLVGYGSIPVAMALTGALLQRSASLTVEALTAAAGLVVLVLCCSPAFLRAANPFARRDLEQKENL